MKKLLIKMGTVIVVCLATIFFSQAEVHATETNSTEATQTAEQCTHDNAYKIVLLPETYELTESYVIHCDNCNQDIETVLPQSKLTDLANNTNVAEADVTLLEATEESEGIACDINENGVSINVRTIEKINTLKFTELEEEKTIFLAPSSQSENMYHNQVNSEAEIMNEIMDLIESNLQECEKLTIVRNDPSKYVLDYIEDSNAANPDLHFSLHSNGCEHHTARGPLVIANPYNPESIKWANTMYDGLISIYPEPSHGRGVVEDFDFYEISRVNAPSIIVEVAFHDQEDDEKWILENKQQIADALTESLINSMNEME